MSGQPNATPEWPTPHQRHTTARDGSASDVGPTAEPIGPGYHAPIDFNTRKLFHFVAVAEELHFSKAAARVHLAQQALSRDIKGLEEELGAKLLERSTRKVTLTPAGEVFLEGARTALTALDAAASAARRAAREPTGTLRLGYVPGAALELTPLILDEFRKHHPDVVVEMQEFPVNDSSAGLASGATDVAFVRLPKGIANIATEVLFVDPVVAMVPNAHHLAGRRSVSARDLVGDPITNGDTLDETYRAFWCLDAVRDESTRARVVPINSITEEAQLVAAGAAIAITSAVVMHFMPVPGVQFLAIDDWPGSAIALGWHRDQPSPVVAQFLDVARSVRDRESELVYAMENRPTTP
ncbi:LysR family transcriptional regulator [[Mycobacterium] crassicus]|uniref:LysR substrate-binding domain-containing protein n=1 Tax=[Mycobacterium] crassicus TaxID=2872309 RepID=A0ABU5XH46_9MYCO|nr:LysR substrate-binding domain-containing protein [Mycolicibacter sp. MYC098]MEB3021574.1 LysR substrate-binding domain-containing protein [Mycolicibacter sp. MYC098]